MAETGFGTTLVGVTAGAITGLKEVAVGGYSVNMINYSTLADSNQISQNLKGAVTRGPITATIVFEKAVYEALETAARNATADSWTLTDADGNVWTGSGWVSNVGEVGNSPDGENTFTLEVTPVDDWDYTAVS